MVRAIQLGLAVGPLANSKRHFQGKDNGRMGRKMPSVRGAPPVPPNRNSTAPVQGVREEIHAVAQQPPVVQSMTAGASAATDKYLAKLLRVKLNVSVTSELQARAQWTTEAVRSLVGAVRWETLMEEYSGSEMDAISHVWRELQVQDATKRNDWQDATLAKQLQLQDDKVMANVKACQELADAALARQLREKEEQSEVLRKARQSAVKQTGWSLPKKYQKSNVHGAEAWPKVGSKSAKERTPRAVGRASKPQPPLRVVSIRPKQRAARPAAGPASVPSYMQSAYYEDPQLEVVRLTLRDYLAERQDGLVEAADIPFSGTSRSHGLAGAAREEQQPETEHEESDRVEENSTLPTRTLEGCSTRNAVLQHFGAMQRKRSHSCGDMRRSCGGPVSTRATVRTVEATGAYDSAKVEHADRHESSSVADGTLGYHKQALRKLREVQEQLMPGGVDSRVEKKTFIEYDKRLQTRAKQVFATDKLPKMGSAGQGPRRPAESQEGAFMEETIFSQNPFAENVPAVAPPVSNSSAARRTRYTEYMQHMRLGKAYNDLLLALLCEAIELAQKDKSTETDPVYTWYTQYMQGSGTKRYKELYDGVRAEMHDTSAVTAQAYVKTLRTTAETATGFAGADGKMYRRVKHAAKLMEEKRKLNSPEMQQKVASATAEFLPFPGAAAAAAPPAAAAGAVAVGDDNRPTLPTITQHHALAHWTCTAGRHGLKVSCSNEAALMAAYLADPAAPAAVEAEMTVAMAPRPDGHLTEDLKIFLLDNLSTQ